jgi:hypothetical protein
MPRYAKSLICCGTLLITTISLWTGPSLHAAGDMVDGHDAHSVERKIPTPRPDHPGNVFLDTETVWVGVPPSTPPKARTWRVLDDRGQTVKSGPLPKQTDLPSPRVNLGQMPIGWYRMEFLDAQQSCLHWTTAAVLHRLNAPTPQDSPICVDSATAWFARDQVEDQARLASLAALAGVNWVRDRLTWRELEPEPAAFNSAQTTYDSSALVQARQGLKVLQVFHSTPDWAWHPELDGPHPSGRFPRDLRHVYRFCRALAQRFQGRVQAWEPWNEANVSTFGGHTVDAMCSFQKAAYLGFKAGDPHSTVCWNAYTTTPTQRHTQGLQENEAGSYFDVYSLHSYDWAHSYESLWAPARQAAGGKPIWVTEADRGLKYTGPEPWCDLSQEDALRKARYMAQSYASSLYAGSTRHFHFILGHYTESHNHVQFGLLRKDMSPQPAYVALAALGRLLAGAKCLGRWTIPDQAHAHVYAFRAKPDGREQDVLVAWAEREVDWAQRDQTQASFKLPASWPVKEVYDYLGRPLGDMPKALTGNALFIVLRAGQTKAVTLTQQPVSTPQDNQACPIVLQAQIARDLEVKITPLPWSQGYEYRLPPDEPYRLHLVAYNFTDKAATGSIRIRKLPANWQVDQTQWHLSLEPMQQQAFTCTLTLPAAQNGSLQLSGDFGSQGRTALACRIQTP